MPRKDYELSLNSAGSLILLLISAGIEIKMGIVEFVIAAEPQWLALIVCVYFTTQ